MIEAADKLDYEHAAGLRDRIKRLERRVFGMDTPPPPPAAPPGSARTAMAESQAKSARPSDGLRPRRPVRGRMKSGPQAPLKQGRLKLTPDR
jgi:hypothetical protein